MAEPHTQADEARAKGNATPPLQSAERRSFQDAALNQSAEAKGAAPSEVVARVAHAAAEATQHAGRQAISAWRQSFDPLLAMQYDMSRWMDDAFRHAFGFRGAPATQAFRPMGQFGAASLFGMPPTDFKETSHAHLLSIELPGLGRDDVDLALDGDLLVVSGHKAEESEDANASYRVSERRFGRFERAFPLPPDVDPSRIEAQFRDGVLKVTLPKTAAAAQARQRIDIKG
jgi:HSP20 family protein